MQLYLIRHAQSQNNARPESERIEDPGITEVGQRQARLLADRFAGQGVTHLLTSAFRRALQTTRPLANSLGLTPRIWTELHERGGCYRGYQPGQQEGRPGLTRRELQRDFPEFEIPSDIDQHGWWKSRPHETFAQAWSRAGRQVDRLFAEFAGTDAEVACVIHADFKELMLRRILEEKFDHHLGASLLNVSVSHFRFEGRQPQLVALCDVTHVPDGLRTE